MQGPILIWSDGILDEVECAGDESVRYLLDDILVLASSQKLDDL